MSYLNLWENVEPLNVKKDEEYPDWVWELVPESDVYWWTDLVQTPFENLSEIEKDALIQRWHKTKKLADEMWKQSEWGIYFIQKN